MLSFVKFEANTVSFIKIPTQFPTSLLLLLPLSSSGQSIPLKQINPKTMNTAKIIIVYVSLSIGGLIFHRTRHRNSSTLLAPFPSNSHLSTARERETHVDPPVPKYGLRLSSWITLGMKVFAIYTCGQLREQSLDESAYRALYPPLLNPQREAETARAHACART